MKSSGGGGAGKAIPAKNKTPAPVQITAEQLLREAKERQLEYVAPVSAYKTFHSFTIFLSLSLSCNMGLLFDLFWFDISLAAQAKDIRPGGVERDAFEEEKRVRGQYQTKSTQSIQLDKIRSMGRVPKGDKPS